MWNNEWTVKGVQRLQVKKRQVKSHHKKRLRINPIKDKDTEYQVTNKEDVTDYTRIKTGHLKIKIYNTKSESFRHYIK